MGSGGSFGFTKTKNLGQNRSLISSDKSVGSRMRKPRTCLRKGIESKMVKLLVMKSLEVKVFGMNLSSGTRLLFVEVKGSKNRS